MANTNFSIVQGDKWQLTITYEDTNGTPINISNQTIVAEVASKPGSKESISSISTTSGGIISVDDGIGATIIVTFPGSETKKFALPKSYYQIKIQDTQDTLLNGWVEVEAGLI
jgi:hypothetical protein